MHVKDDASTIADGASNPVVSLTPSLQFEQQLFDQGSQWVIGLDEVGRGSLAGPVMVGAALIGVQQLETAHHFPLGLADSKLLTEKKREALVEPLKNWVEAWAVGSCTNREIDEWGIGYALGIAALKAIVKVTEHLSKCSGNHQQSSVSHNVSHNDGDNDCHNISIPRVSAILDGPFNYIDKVIGSFDAPYMPIPVHIHTLVKADRQCASVAAAAVIAKVTRDRLMVELAEQSPYAVYDWAHNKGYGSRAHREAIAQYGPSDLHRISWHLQ